MSNPKFPDYPVPVPVAGNQWLFDILLVADFVLSIHIRDNSKITVSQSIPSPVML
jgi:hypothetical protein